MFGVEGLLSDELKRLGADNVTAQNGRVLFSGDVNIMARANICSRFAERVLILLGSFRARTFTELFDNVVKIPLEDYIGSRDAFPVKGYSLNSKLHSVPDCQKIIKKAAVKRLSGAYHIDWFEETGTRMQLQFSLMNDECMIMLDTSGEGLHKRGYRAASNISPIKETLAAAMASPLSRVISPSSAISSSALVRASPSRRHSMMANWPLLEVALGFWGYRRILVVVTVSNS